MTITKITDYLAGEEVSEVKHEYLGGTVHAMAGASNRHNGIATSALLALGTQLRGKTCQPFNSDTKVRIEFPDHTRFYRKPIIIRTNRWWSLKSSASPRVAPI